MLEVLHYEFIQNALIAGVLISIAAGIIGSLVVVNKITFLTGGIAHSSYGGIGLAIYLGIPVLFGALCSNPKIMLLDEPTASIDVKGQREVYELLKELNKNICIVVVSHDISVLLNYAKNVAHINKNLVYHSLENIQKNISTSNEHLCEVELLSALGKTQACCNHVH